jgi:hypothetical protein
MDENEADMSDQVHDHLIEPECRMTGLEFGAEFAHQPREAFEVALLGQLAALDERLAVTARNADAVAAFDQAAWDVWEAVHGSP